MLRNSPPIADLLARYPKQRPELTPEMQAMHMDILKANRERETLISLVSHRLESWMHHKVARGGRESGSPILEIGAGTLNHIPFEPDDLDYDAIEPLSALYEGKPELARIRNLYADLSEIKVDQKYGRIISIATLEHLTDLPGVVARSALELKTDGLFCAGIPSEGGFLWGLSWRISTALAFRLKTGLDFSRHMEYEHVNDADEIVRVLKHFFADVSIVRFPLPIFHLSLYEYVECRQPRHEICQQYLRSRGQLSSVPTSQGEA